MDKKSLEGFDLPKRKSKRAKFRAAIEKHGLEEVLRNPFRFLPLAKSQYSKRYIKNIRYFITKKRNGTA